MTLDEFREFVKAGRWHFAKTMPKHPHFYVRKRESDPKRFMEAARFVWENGTPRKWFNRVYRYLEVDGYEYWLAAPFQKDTVIINRRPLDE